MGTLYLVRHGQASFGAENYDKLSETGARQSRALGEFFAEHQPGFSFALSGELQRQRHSAQIVAETHASVGSQFPDLEVHHAFNEFGAEQLFRHALPELLELEPGLLEVMAAPRESRREFQRIFSRLVTLWVSGQFSHELLESWDDFRTRVRGGVESVAEKLGKSEKAVIFTSGGVITAALREFGGVADRRAFDWNWQIVNTSVTRLKCRRDDISLESFNSFHHLELLKDAGLITYR